MRARRNYARRTAGWFLLAVAGWAALAGSAHATAGRTEAASSVQVQRVREALDAAAPATQLLLPRDVRSAPDCVPLARIAPLSASINLKGRIIFVEGTNTLSSEALQADQLDCAMESCKSPLPIYAAFRNRSTTPANRQRAP